MRQHTSARNALAAMKPIAFVYLIVCAGLIAGAQSPDRAALAQKFAPTTVNVPPTQLSAAIDNFQYLKQ